MYHWQPTQDTLSSCAPYSCNPFLLFQLIGTVELLAFLSFLSFFDRTSTNKKALRPTHDRTLYDTTSSESQKCTQIGVRRKPHSRCVPSPPSPTHDSTLRATGETMPEHPQGAFCPEKGSAASTLPSLAYLVQVERTQMPPPICRP